MTFDEKKTLLNAPLRSAFPWVAELVDERDAEIERLRELFREFRLECCEDWTCAQDHAAKTAAAIREARAESAELRKTAANQARVNGELAAELDWFRRLYEWLQDHVVENGESEMCTALQAYVIDNPKPGDRHAARTLPKCTDPNCPSCDLPCEDDDEEIPEGAGT